MQWILVIALMLGLNPVHAQGEPPKAPVPNHPEGIFVDALEISLEGSGMGIIYFDTNAVGEWSIADAHIYLEPFKITETTVIRTQQVYGVGNYSDLGRYTFTKDRPPTASITFPANGQYLRSNAQYTLTASAQDLDGDALRVTFEYLVGTPGSWQTLGTDTSGPSFELNWTPAVVAAHRLRARVSDVHGAQGVSSEVNFTVTEPNRGPSAVLTAPGSGTAFIIGQSIGISATASDSDFSSGGAITRVDFYHEDTLIASDNSAPYSANWTNATLGTHVLQARAYDNHSPAAMGVSANVTITVRPPNKKPTVTLASSNPGPISAPASFTLTATASDSDGSISRVVFYRTGGPAFSPVTDLTAPFQLPVTNLAAGSYTFTARAFDNASPADSATSAGVVITVNANGSPTANAGRDTVIIQPADSVLLRGQGSDPEGGPVTYAWTAPTGVTLANANTASPKATINATGNYTLTLTVTDGIGQTAQDQVVISVHARPVITDTRLIDSVNIGTPYNHALSATGFPTPTITTGTPLPPGLTRTGNTISGTPTQAGTFNISITAANSAGSDTRTLVLTVRDPARITQEMPESTVVLERSRVTLTVAAAGTPPPRFQWQFVPQGGQPQNVGSNSPSHTIDTVNLSNSGSYRVIVTNNVNPPDTSRANRLIVRALIRITSQPVGFGAIAGQRVTLQVQATGAPVLLYQWYRDNAALSATPAAGNSILTLDPVRTGDAGFYRVRVTSTAFTDTTRAGTFQWSVPAQLTVTLPKIDKPKADPAAPMDFREAGVTVSLRTDTPSTVIRYTRNGAIPTSTTGTVYDPAAKIPITGATTTIRARAFRNGYVESDVFEGTYTYVPPTQAAKPTARPVKANFTTALICTLTSSTPGSTIWFTLDKSDPRTASRTTFSYSESGPFYIPSTTTVTAYATAPGFTASDTLVKVYTLDMPPAQVLPPEASPPGTPFTQELMVTLTSKTDSALIRYTLDGTAPENSPTALTIPNGSSIRLTSATLLNAVATRPGFLNSDQATYSYPLIPGPIEASPAPVGGNHTFDDKVVVTLKVTPPGARIYYTTNDSLPLDNQRNPTSDASVYGDTGITLTSSFNITAMAVSDTVASRPYTFSYTLRGGPLPTPLVTTSNHGYTFKDTLRITLKPTNGATIHFTRNGGDPTRASEVYTGPFTIDSTLTLQTLAVHKDFQDSRIQMTTFTLVADTPRASPRGGPIYAPLDVTLKATSAKTPIMYTLDGSLPTPDTWKSYTGTPIPIDGTTTLRAVALAEGVPGPVMTEEYRFIAARDTLLAPGEIAMLDGGYTLSNPADQGILVRVRQGPADTRSLSGFQNVQFSLILDAIGQGGKPAEGFPEMVFSKSSSNTRSLFKLNPDGKIYFLSGAVEHTITEGGTYFTGRDTQSPEVQYLKESIDDSGFTTVTFKIKDNVHNLAYSSKRNDNPALNASMQPAFSGNELSFRLKHASGLLKPLSLQVSVFDYSNLAFCPADGASFLYLSQSLVNLAGPRIWRVGGSAEAPHDLVGIPLNLDPPLTLGELVDSRKGQVEALVYQDGSATPWRRLDRKDPLVPGQAYWLGAHAELTGFKRDAARTAPTGPAKFKVRLKPGWNQVANPHLETLYWPYARALGDLYRTFRVKGLWAYAAIPGDTSRYVESDSLEPWKGYYVYNHLGDTTSVELSGKPILKPVGKMASSGQEASLTFGFGDAPQVRLGASPLSTDAVSWDDEGLLPSLSARNRLRAVRDGRSLSSDWVRLESGSILRWRVLPGPAAGAGEIPAVRIRASSLPEGYEAWAVSRLRGMKFRLEAGGALPATGVPNDTLLVLAGPSAKLAGHSLLQGLAEQAPALDLRILRRGLGPEIRLDLPSLSQVRATLWSLRGSSLGRLQRNLPGGRYHFRLPGDLGAGSAPPGVYFLRVEVRGPEGRSVLTRKVVFNP